MKIITSAILIALLISCSTTSNEKKEEKSSENEAPTERSSITLKHVWSTDTLLTTAESAIYDQERNVIYVANINENPWEMDGNGFISIVDLEGSILNLEWVTGLNAPKGMGIVKNSLFVTDNNAVVEVDIPTGQVKKRIVCRDEDPKLNDITVGKDGSIYVSASEVSKVYMLQNENLEVFSDEDYQRPNGLLAEEDRLLILSFNAGALSQIDYNSKELTKLANGIGKADGIIKLPEDLGYITSSWSGQVFHVSSNYEVKKLLDTEEQGMGAADIEYIEDPKLLLVPTFYDNRLIAYEVTNK